MTGINIDNPRLDRNGCGKSSLLDAICWCLEGKTTRSLRANDIISRGYNSCFVCVVLIVGNEELTVKATQNPNSLTCNGHIIDREALTKRLRLNFQSFLYSIIIPQAGNSFLDLSPGEKLTLFSQIMDLDLWLEKSELALEKSNEIKNLISICEKDIAQLNGRFTAISSTIKELIVKSTEFDQLKQEKIDKLTSEFNKKVAEIEGLKTDIAAFDLIIKELGPKIKHAEDACRGQNQRINDLDAELIEADKELLIVDREIRGIKESQSNFEQVGTTCPTCKQRVDKKHLTKELEKLESELTELKGMKSALVEAKQDINANKSEVIISVSKLDAEFTQLRTKETKAKGNKNALENEIIYLEREGIRIGSEIRRTKEQKNEFDHMISDKRNEASGINKRITDIEHKIAQLNEDYATTYFWVGGFKRLRLHIIEETLRTLEVEVNNNLTSLGLGDWKIEFDIERENKSGGVTRGFITLITDPRGYTAKYETLSFGETQRVKLAGCFGLANLIMERAGLVSKIELYDEPSEHMTEEGITDTLNTLRDRAINNDRAIVVIDHHAIDYADFAGTIMIEKNENGSRII